MKRYLKAAKQSLMVMLLCTVLLLVSYILPINNFGIVPRDSHHLFGIIFAPFLHGDWAHLLSNFLPFVILSSLIGLHSLKRFWLVFSFSILMTGILVWTFARGGSVHIGMSGVVYAMWGYLIVYGFNKRHFRDLLIAVLVIVIYGGLVFGVLPSTPNVSFESHLFGTLAGGLLGYYFSKKR